MKNKHIKKNHTIKPLVYGIRTAIFTAGMAAATSGVVIAGPTGGVITHGSGQISNPNAQSTIINQNSQRLVANWQTYNIRPGETVTYKQPNSSAIALNHILDQNPSQIFGSLNANGRVFLVNPNGMYFGKSARVNVGSLVATTLKIDSKKFMNGMNVFGDLNIPAGDGVIVNQGLLQAATGGSISLIAGEVRNEGVIVANLGHVNLASGRKATLDFDGDGLIQFEIQGNIEQNTSQAENAVLNSGEIIANGGQVLLTAAAAKDVFTNVVNNEGIIRANSIENRNGEIFLVGIDAGIVRDSGLLDASGKDAGETGGTIKLLGEKVGLFNAELNVSGNAGGGEVLVGGNEQGKGEERNATYTYIDKNTTINADAIEMGDGGKVIVWADDTTRFYGNITAKGGYRFGNGGFVEISGKKNLAVRGGVDLSSANGNVGSLLIDPDDIVIADGAGGANDGELGALDGTVAFADGGNVTFTISEQVLEGLSSLLDILLQANNTITINDLTDNALTLDQTGSVTFQTGTGDFSMNAGDLIDLTGGANLNIAVGGGISIGGVSTTGSLTMSSSGAITGSGALVIGSETSLTAGSANNITLNNAGNDFSSVSINSANDVSLVDLNGLVLGASTVTGNLAVTATTGNIIDSGTVTVGGNADFTTIATGANIDLGTLDVAGTIAVNTAVGGSVLNLTNANGLNFQTSSVGGNLNATATTGNITDSGTVTVGGNADFTTSTADADIDLGTLNVVGTVAVHTTGTGGDVLNLTNANGINFQTSSVGGNLTATATTGNITDSGTVTVGGNADFTTIATGANIDLGTLDVAGTIAVNTAVGGSVLNLTNANGLNFQTSSVGGNLNATATTGNIIDSGTVIVGGNADFTTSTADADIDLGTLNVFGTVAVHTTGTGGDVLNLTNANGLNFQTSSVGGNLNATATTGNIIDSGTVTVSGNASFTTAAANADIDLGSLAVTSSTAVNTTGTTGNVTLVNNTALDLAASIVHGDLMVTLTGNGNLTDSGPIVVDGTAFFDVGITNDIILDNPANDFSTNSLSILAANNATITDKNAINLSGVTVQNDFTLNAGGDVTTTADLTVGGDTKIISSNSDVILGGKDHSAKLKGAVSITAHNAQVIRNDTGPSSVLNLEIIDLTGIGVFVSGAEINRAGPEGNSTSFIKANELFLKSDRIGTQTNPLELKLAGGNGPVFVDSPNDAFFDGEFNFSRSGTFFFDLDSVTNKIFTQFVGQNGLNAGIRNVTLDRLNGAERGRLIDTESAVVDAALFDESVTMFSILDPGLLLPSDQLEDDEDDEDVAQSWNIEDKLQQNEAGQWELQGSSEMFDFSDKMDDELTVSSNQ
ncbi:MAG: filamentous hemagglutinin N-terminal domain-containing protein [Methylococcaceae bacterium]|nr:filamentous hemagglutinin N-terminal domain-containing protein [Methylococcaceae bacterium]